MVQVLRVRLLPNWESVCSFKRQRVTLRSITRYSCPLPSSRSLEYHSTNDSGSDCQSAHDRDAYQALFRHFFIDETPQTASLHVCRLMIQQNFIVSPSLRVIAQLVVAQGQIV